MNETILFRMLNKKGLSITLIRKQLLTLFVDAKKPLPRTYIEEKMRECADRVTIYRNLLVLSEKSIIRKISAEEGGLYVLNYKKERKQHLHFQCRNCHEVYCFENVKIAESLLPKDFKIENIEFTAVGICQNCLKV